MVNSKNMMIAFVALFLGIGVIFFFFPTEEKRVKKRLTLLSKWVAKESDESNLTMARKLRNIESVFAETCRFDAPANDVSETYSAGEIAQKATIARSHFSTLSVKFYDLDIHFPEDNIATVITTAKLTGISTEGETIDETHELECTLQNIADTWMFTEVEVVEVLKK